jgi:hypothetical protein
MTNLSTTELIQIANEAQVLHHMSLDQTTRLIVDHVPARGSISIPREHGDRNSCLEVFPPEVNTLTFVLEDATFGDTIYVTLTCNNRVIVNPFKWSGYAHLATVSISIP